MQSATQSHRTPRSSVLTFARAAKPVVRKLATGHQRVQVNPTGLSGLGAHDLVAKGIDVADAKQVMAGFTIINEKQFYGVLGITERTMQRRAASATKTLDVNASDRALRLVTVMHQATEVLGSQEAAERWLSSPAMGLDQRIPIDLLQSSEGTAMVKTLLSRMEYGVYA
jgi:putative toxin-antitoxin system antitoxin component (TIGR02293 family)